MLTEQKQTLAAWFRTAAGELIHARAGTLGDATLAILSPAASVGPFAVDRSGEEPWKSLRPPSVN